GARGTGLGLRLRLAALAGRARTRLLLVALVALRARAGVRFGGLAAVVPGPVAAPPAIIVVEAPAGPGVGAGVDGARRLHHREREEEGLRGAGTARRHGEGSRKDERSAVDRSDVHECLPCRHERISFLVVQAGGRGCDTDHRSAPTRINLASRPAICL